jgi:predicted nucleic acid-binding protein
MCRAVKIREQFPVEHREHGAYDGAYLALAESLNATVVTCDRPFGSAPGHGARIEVIRSAPERRRSGR